MLTLQRIWSCAKCWYTPKLLSENAPCISLTQNFCYLDKHFTSNTIPKSKSMQTSCCNRHSDSETKEKEHQATTEASQTKGSLDQLLLVYLGINVLHYFNASIDKEGIQSTTRIPETQNCKTTQYPSIHTKSIFRRLRYISRFPTLSMQVANDN